MVRANDAASSGDSGNEGANDRKVLKRKGGGQGEEKRKYLKSWELLPAQLLNVYGRAAYQHMEYDELWANFKKPQKTGAAYMTELCDDTVERRSIGINRWACALRDFCKYQRREEVKKENKKVMQEDIRKKMYDEIDKVYDALDYVCAERKKKGTSSLRARVEDDVSEPKSETKLQDSAKIVYEWLHQKKSYVRLVHQWQAAGGLSFVANVYNTGMQAFLAHGNEGCGKDGDAIPLSVFQKCILDRHDVSKTRKTKRKDRDVSEE